MRGKRAYRAAHLFREHDETSVRAMADLESDADDEVYVSIARQHMENLQNALQSDREVFASAPDPAWTSGTAKPPE